MRQKLGSLNAQNARTDGEATAKMDFRQPYADKEIGDIKIEDALVSVSGIVVSKNENLFVIDDGNSQLEIIFNGLNFPVNTFVRVFGRVLPYENGLSLQADFVQDLSNINKELYKKVRELLK